jgi:integrase
MTRSDSRLPKHSLHKASGQGYVRFKGSSRPFYTGKFGTPEATSRYDRLIRDYVTNGRRPPDPERAGQSLIADLAADFWSHFLSIHPNSREPEGLKFALKPFLVLFGSMPVSEFSSLHLLQARDAMIEKGISRKLINSRITRLKRMFRWGVSRQLFPATAQQEIQAVEGLRNGRSAAKENPPVAVVPLENVQAVQPLVSRQIAAMIQLQVLTGARPGEILIMRGMDLDRTGDVWRYRPSHHKNKHRQLDREIPIGPRAQAIIRPYLLRPSSAFLFNPKEAEADRHEAQAAARKSKVTPSQLERHIRWSKAPRSKLGDSYLIAGYRRAIARACKLAKVPRWSPNQLRHLAATRFRAADGLDAAQVILGHTHARTTEIYAEVNRSKIEKVMLEIG